MDNKIILVISIIAILFLGGLGFTGYAFWNKENSDILGNCEFIDSPNDYDSSCEIRKGNDMCIEFGYSRCFATQITNIDTYFSSMDGSCTGNKPYVIMDNYLEDCVDLIFSPVTNCMQAGSNEFIGIASDKSSKLRFDGVICCKR